MAQGQILTATGAAVVGAVGQSHLRGMLPVADKTTQTAILAGGGIAVAGAGVYAMKKSNGAGYVGPALVGLGVGVTLGAISDHFGF